MSQTLLSPSPPSSSAAPPLAALIWGHLSALWPIRRLDASLLEMPWAWSRPEVSVRGATGWLLTRGKGIRQSRGKTSKIREEEKLKKGRKWTWERKKRRERLLQVEVCHLWTAGGETERKGRLDGCGVGSNGRLQRADSSSNNAFWDPSVLFYNMFYVLKSCFSSEQLISLQNSLCLGLQAAHCWLWRA